MKKIELNILVFILIEALSLLFFFKVSILNIILGTTLGSILLFITKKIKINKILQIILLFVTSILAIITLIKISSFISSNLLKNYPLIFIIISLFLACLYLAIKGYHTYIKALETIFYFFLFNKIFSIILIIPYIDLNNLNINLLQELKIDIHFIYISIIILFMGILIRFLTNNYINRIYLIASINPIIMKILSISVIGTTLFNIYDYPFMNVLKRIKYLEFIERMEGILSFEFCSSFIFLESFFILLILFIIKNIIKKK